MTQEEQVHKYSYKYKVVAAGGAPAKEDEPDKFELQSYINEVLGLTKTRKQKTQDDY